MKKLISLCAIGAICASLAVQAFAYTLTLEDAAIVDRASAKLERMITRKGESYRDRYVRALRGLQLRYSGNERMYAIIGATIDKINEDDDTAVAGVFGNISSNNNPSTPSTPSTPVTPPNIGGQRDNHGCLIPGGYSWCEAKQKCLRSWEEKCEVVTSVNPPAFSSIDLDAEHNTESYATRETVFSAKFRSPIADVIKIQMSWGDGTPVSEYNMSVNANDYSTYYPRHTFTKAGQYSVEGTVTSTKTGLSTKASMRVNVVALPCSSSGDICVYGGICENGQWKCNSIIFDLIDITTPVSERGINRDINFRARIKTTAMKQNVRLIVDFGDNTSKFDEVVEISPNSSYVDFAHKYSTAGNYFITATAQVVGSALQATAGGSVIIVASESRYPYCNANDIKVGNQYWAACNYGSQNVGQKGDYVPWGSLGGDVTTDWLITSSSKSPSGNQGDPGPCAVGYHVPTLEEMRYAVSQAGGAYRFFEILQAPMSGYYTLEGLHLGNYSSVFWLSTKYPYGPYFTYQDNPLPGAAFSLESAGVPNITTPMKYVDNNFSFIEQQHLGKGAKAQIRCVKNY